MSVLLDTNAFLWQTLFKDGGELGPKTLERMQSAEIVYVSSISVVEIQIKAMLGRLTAPSDCGSLIAEAGDVVLNFNEVAADALTQFPKLARHDPFDRMILASAYAHNLTLVTSDKTLLSLDPPFIINARL